MVHPFERLASPDDPPPITRSLSTAIVKIMLASFDDGVVSVQSVSDLASEVRRYEFRSNMSPIWVDVELPEEIEIAQGVLKSLQIVFRLDENAIRDIIFRNFDSEALSDDTCGCLVLVEPLPLQGMQATCMEIAVCVKEHFVLTLHYGPILTAAEIFQEIASERVCCESGLVSAIGVALADSYQPALLEVQAEADNLTDLVLLLSRKEQADVLRRFMAVRKVISRAKSWLFRQTIAMTKVSSHLYDCTCTTDTMRLPLSLVRNMYKQFDAVDMSADTGMQAYAVRSNLEGVLVQERANNTMRRIAAVSAVFLPLTLVSAIFGMNIRLPGMIGYGDDPHLAWFSVISATMIVVAILMLIWFKRRRWI
eukprot:TRINITY_DN8830_c0_g1_i1.p1 TRINITY_DN8830_c0_g1~~TRINITY_DN8830_c0_g1_i1.p1  ORF type:complete len:366 (+),score=55.44 TRINITY_DN8830_c0_g1_i1:74-1171(+)